MERFQPPPDSENQMLQNGSVSRYGEWELTNAYRNNGSQIKMPRTGCGILRSHGIVEVNSVLSCLFLLDNRLPFRAGKVRGHDIRDMEE
jgi:hypothetical protein